MKIVWKGIIVAAATSISTAAIALDRSGIHAFINDDDKQFANFYLNDDGKVSIEADNGQQWRPMHIVIHARYLDAHGAELTTKHYYVNALASLMGSAKKREFVFANPGVTGVHRIELSSNKVAPRGRREDHWEIPVGGFAFDDDGRVPVKRWVPPHIWNLIH